jgi:hypothetical protein
MLTKYWSESLKGRIHSEDEGVRWKDNIRVELSVRWEIMDWMHLAQDRDQ